MNNTKTSESIKKLCGMAVFCALAYVSVLVAPIKVQFLTFDCKDAVMGLSAMLYGPVSGMVMSLVTSLIEMVTVSTTGPWGMLMNFISSTVFVVAASLIYKYKRSMSGAIIGLCVSVFATTGVMMLANLFITPLYLHAPRADVAAMIPKLLFPFNLTKYLLNASLVLLLYKPLVKALRRAGFVKSREESANSSCAPKYQSLIVSIVAVAVIAACIAVFILVMGGSITFGVKK